MKQSAATELQGPEMGENPFSKEKMGPKIVSELRLKRHANGNLAVAKHHENYGHLPETRTFRPSEAKEFMAHVAKHMGIKQEAEPEAPAEGAESEEE